MSQNTINIGGKADGNVFVVGDNISAGNIQANIANNMPAPESVDIKKTLAEISKILAKLESPDQKRINNAVDEAQDEAKKTEPDKDEIGGALERAMKYAKQAGTFSTVIETLKPHVLSVSAWLGENWHKIAGMITM